MDLRHEKLTLREIGQLNKITVLGIRPYSLLPAPTYILRSSNNEYALLKEPLGFFTPEDVEKLTSYRYLYFTDFFKNVIPYQTAGARVRSLLEKKEVIPLKNPMPRYPKIFLPPPPNELSDAILRLIGPLWWYYSDYGPAIEGFFVSVFVEKLCRSLPTQLLLVGRSADSKLYNQAIFKSSWAVFLALHLSCVDFEYLNKIRVRVFEETIYSKYSLKVESETDEIVEFAHKSLRGDQFRLIRANIIVGTGSRIRDKLVSRIDRIRDHFISEGGRPPSIYGPGGFADG